MIKPCLQWPGSKARIAPQIVKQMRAHSAYLEPFGGSLAVLLAKPKVPVEMINDQYEMLITFYKVLRTKPDALTRALMLTPYARVEFQDSGDYNAKGLSDLERARRFFVRINQAFVSSNGYGSWTATMHSSAQHSNASKWARFQERLYAVADRLTGVQIECGDWEKFIDSMLKKTDKDCVVYCDPPYLASSRKGSRYEHDMSTPEEHEHMLARLLEVSASGRQVLISGYANDEYDAALPGWDHFTMSTTRNSRAGKGSTQQEECLWISPARRTIRRRLTPT